MNHKEESLSEIERTFWRSRIKPDRGAARDVSDGMARKCES
jgi:hypothetical protein